MLKISHISKIESQKNIDSPFVFAKEYKLAHFLNVAKKKNFQNV